MKLLGCGMVVAGAAALFVCWRRELHLERRWGEQLLADLALLRREICISRRALPDILENDLSGGDLTGPVWAALLINLPLGRETAWKRFHETLVPSFAPAFISLEQQLWAGGEPLARAIDETREELARCLRERRQRDAERIKLRGALCFSAAALLILVLI